MFKYTSFPGEKDYNVEFDAAYLKKRGWKAAITLPGILRQMTFSPFLKSINFIKNKPPELIELINQGADNIDDALSYWLAFNCIGRWDKVGRYKVEFEEECDAFLYKLMWSEYL